MANARWCDVPRLEHRHRNLVVPSSGPSAFSCQPSHLPALLDASCLLLSGCMIVGLDSRVCPELMFGCSCGEIKNSKSKEAATMVSGVASHLNVQLPVADDLKVFVLCCVWKICLLATKQSLSWLQRGPCTSSWSDSQDLLLFDAVAAVTHMCPHACSCFSILVAWWVTLFAFFERRVRTKPVPLARVRYTT